MSEPVFRCEMLLGSVDLGRGTGRYVQDTDGMWSEVFTDTITRDQYGREVSRRPTEAIVRMSHHPFAMEDRQAPKRRRFPWF